MQSAELAGGPWVVEYRDCNVPSDLSLAFGDEIGCGSCSYFVAWAQLTCVVVVAGELYVWLTPRLISQAPRLISKWSFLI